MAAFQSGFRMGGDMYQQALDNKTRQEELGMKKAAEARAAEMHGLQVSGLRRKEATENELAGIRHETKNFQSGIDTAATNANLDADFEQAFQATGMGLQAPAMVGGSNAANEAALTARHNLDPNSLKYQLGLNQLAQRYATVSGDMDKVTALSGQGRVLSFQDAMNASRQEFVSMAPEQRSAFLESVTENAGIPLNVVPSQSKTKDGKPEYMVWVEGKPRIRVDDATLSDIFAAGKNLDTYGDLARDFMSKGNDKIRQLFKDYVDIGDKVADTNNQAARYANADANDAARTEIAQQSATQQGEYYRGLVNARTKSEGQTAAATALENKINGVMEGYQAAMAAGPQGQKAAAIYAQEYDQLRATAGQQGLKVPPSIASMVAAQKGAGVQKPTKIEAAGTSYLVPQPDGTERLMFSDGRGGFIDEKGVYPEDRAVHLTKQMGLPPAMASQLEFSKDGRYVLAPNGAEYDVADPKDAKQLREDMVAFAAQDPVEYENRMLLNRAPAPTGMGPRITMRNPDNMPSIYNRDPAAWAAYRQQQQQK
jgi:hypothetical protein